MTVINGNRGISAPYSSPINLVTDKKSAPIFGELLASSITKTSLTPVGITPSASGTSFASQLSDVLYAYDIDVPPAIRITSNANGLELSGDNRDMQFQSMLKDRPDIAQGLSALIGTAQSDRKTALDGVMSTFAGNDPSGSISRFLDGFEASEKSKGYSIKFNGADTSVEEMGDNGWEPVKDKKTFMADLLEAYTAYLTKNQVRTTSDKDDKANDATAQRDKKTDDAKSV